MVKSYSNLILIASLLLSAGCTAMPPPRALAPEMTVNDVIQLSQNAIPDVTIIGQIETTRTVFHLQTDDIIQLKDAGVSTAVTNHMLYTEKRDIAIQERARYRYYCDRCCEYHSSFFHHRHYW
ncbi:MAG: hypothetical protein Q8Q33_07735 [Chlamydiota bacterium]|nr:hypothetical protein [Chlamydiota bacterium]